MHDIVGFAIVLLMFFLGMYGLVQFVLPFLAVYTFGTMAFFVSAVIFLKHGRVAPHRLDCLLKPRFSVLLAILAIGFPIIHAVGLVLFTDNEYWFYIATINATAPLAWTLRILFLHTRQRKVWTAKGYDLEELLVNVKAKYSALEVMADTLDTLRSTERIPEPWELAAGGSIRTEPTILAEMAEIARKIASLRTELRMVEDRVSTMLEPIGSVAPPRKDVSTVRETIDGLLARADELLELAQRTQGDFHGGTLVSWD